MAARAARACRTNWEGQSACLPTRPERRSAAEAAARASLAGGGAGVLIAPVVLVSTIATLSNSGTISGGAGGGGASDGGRGGVGIRNAATSSGTTGRITTLTNSGKILGGNGGGGTSRGGSGGAGIWNAGAIGPLVNSGTIEGGSGGKGSPNGAAGDAIYSAGSHASIGPITNSGKIIGNDEIDNQASVTVTGGAGRTFGSWTGGMITIGNGNLALASGNTALGDDISVDGGAGTVTNKGLLQIATPETITGDFTQSAAGVLGLDFAGVGQYGALTVSKLTTLDGGLAIDLTGGFTWRRATASTSLRSAASRGLASTRLRSTARPAPQRARTSGPAAEACV